MKKMQSFPLSVLSVAMLAAFQPAHAEDDEVAQLTKPESSVSLGLGHWTNDRPQQGIYDGMRDRGAFGNVDLDLVQRNDETGTWLTVTGKNLGLDTREARIDYLRQGNIGLGLEYSRTPRDNPLTFRTGQQGLGTTNQIINGTATPANPHDAQLGTTRDLTSLSFYKNVMPGLDFTATFKNEDKEGSRLWSRGSSIEFIAEPIDSTTRQFEATLAYTGERLQLSGGYYGSWYDNANSQVRVITAGAAATSATFLSLPLDNQAHQLNLDGGYNFTPTTRGTFKLSYSEATQDEHLPSQDVPGLSLAGSPHNLGGEVHTTLAQVALTSHPLDNLSVLASLRYHDLKDKTPVARYVNVDDSPAVGGRGADLCGTIQDRICVENTPMSYETLTGKLEATYRLGMHYSVTGGIDYRSQDREIPVGDLNAAGLDTQRVVPFRAEVEELTYRIEGRRTLSDTANGSLAYLHSTRDGSDYVSAAAGAGGAPSDRISPIHVADRERDKVRLAVDWMPTEPLSLQFAVEYAKDDYSSDAFRRFGVRDGEATLASADASYQLNDDWLATAWLSYDNTKATQFGHRDSGGVNLIKEARLEDTGSAIGIGLRGKLMSNLAFGADLQWSHNESEMPESITNATTGAAVANAGVPAIETEVTKLNLFALYEVSKSSQWRFDFIHERWEADDWTWEFANGSPFVFSSVSDGTTVISNPKQVSNFVGARYIYTFQ